MFTTLHQWLCKFTCLCLFVSIPVTHTLAAGAEESSTQPPQQSTTEVPPEGGQTPGLVVTPPSPPFSPIEGFQPVSRSSSEASLDVPLIGNRTPVRRDVGTPLAERYEAMPVSPAESPVGVLPPLPGQVPTLEDVFANVIFTHTDGSNIVLTTIDGQQRVYSIQAIRVLLAFSILQETTLRLQEQEQELLEQTQQQREARLRARADFARAAQTESERSKAIAADDQAKTESDVAKALTSMNIVGTSCVICAEDFRLSDKIIQTNCNHAFHVECLKGQYEAYFKSLIQYDEDMRAYEESGLDYARAVPRPHPPLCSVCRDKRGLPGFSGLNDEEVKGLEKTMIEDLDRLILEVALKKS